MPELFYHLKDDWFKYCGKKYVMERYLSKCGRFYITIDDSFWLRIYSGNNNRVATKIYDYTMNHSWQIGSLQDVQSNIDSGKLKPLKIITVDKSHFKHKKDFLEYTETISKLVEVENEA